MLPEYSQARKAIWDAINPHTGKRRIDEAFPVELRATTREQEMQIVFINGSTWQVIGSDSYDRLVGASPAGIVYSEWALANPAARGYLRPILAENGGWQIFITTPRGKNHAWETFRAASKDPLALALLIPATSTPVFTAERLEAERLAYIAEYGEDQGQAQYEQEYLCSWEAAILGSYYGREVSRLRASGRFMVVPHDPAVPVHTAWDLGYSDDTSIWWYQVVSGEVHILACHSSSGRTVDFYAELVKTKGQDNGYSYGIHWLPHDARAKTLASQGKSIQEQFAKHFGWKHIRIVPSLSIQDGIQAVRNMFARVWMDVGCEEGLEALSQYCREWDEDKKCFRDLPLHNWCSNYSDAARMLAIAWRKEIEVAPVKPPAVFFEPARATIRELIEKAKRKRLEQESV